MAASDDEGSSGENKNDDPLHNTKGKAFTIMHQEFENKLTKPGISYDDKVGIVLSGWDHLASASNGQLEFATFLYKWTLRLVLQGEWPKLEKIVKTRLRATLQRCTHDQVLHPLCQILIPLVSDPWGHPTLKAIFAKSFVSDEEAEQYINAESWEVIRLRVDTLVESRCEELALSFLKVCMRCIKLQTKNSENCFSQEDHNRFFDLYFVLLYKFNKKQFLEELRQVDLAEGVDHIRRLLAQQEKGRVWKHRLKIAELEIQIFLASSIVKPYEDIYWNVFVEWCEVMKAAAVAPDVLTGMVHKYLQLAESSRHIYTMGSIMHTKFGESYNALVTEVLIRALTLDMNALEGVKVEAKEGTAEEQTRLEHQMADGFMELSVVFEQHAIIARECVLTAFSLHPTDNRFEKIKEFVAIPVNNEENSSVQSESIIENDAHMPTEVKMEISTQSESFSEPYKGEENVTTYSNNTLDANSTVCESNSLPNVNNTIGDNLSDIPPNNTLQSSQNHDSEIKDNININSLDNLPGDSLLVGVSDLRNQCNKNDLINVSENVSGIFDSCNNSKIKDDGDSMDEFITSTENLIQQLKPTEITETKKEERSTCDILTAPQEVLNSEKLGLSKELCDDLAVVLSSPRWQVLTWVLDKNELLSICEKYINDSHSAKNVTRELKYLNLDYEQFKHLPTGSEEHTGIEKGYEHFIEPEEESSEDDYYFGAKGNYSSDSDSDAGKRLRGIGRVRVPRRGRPPLRARPFSSDSDSARSRSKTYTEISDSEDSEYDSVVGCYYYGDKCFEGKRVTSVSCNDRQKRLKVDYATGRVKRAKTSVENLRLYRHNSQMNTPRQQVFVNPNIRNFFPPRRGRPPLHAPRPQNFAPSLGSLNMNPTVVLTHYNQTPATNQIKRFLNVASNNDNTTQSSQIKNLDGIRDNNLSKNEPANATACIKKPITNTGNWKYAGYLVSGPKDQKSPQRAPFVSHQPNTVRCAYRTKEGRVVTLNTRGCFNESDGSSSPKTMEYIKKLSNTSSKYEESFAKFLINQRTDSKAAAEKESFKKNLEYLQRQGTSVIFKKTNNVTVLANAQKNVLNRIMAPENTRTGLSSSIQPMPVRAIAMPVSHNPPNMPLNDKTSPIGLSRVLPKGTTVVRRPKSDSGAGPSGVSGSASTSQSRSNPTQSRPALTITPSNSFFISSQQGGSFTGAISSARNNAMRPLQDITAARTSIESTRNLAEGSSSFQTTASLTENENQHPLSSATAVGSVSQIVSPRLNITTNSPGEIQGGSFGSSEAAHNAIGFNTTTTTSVASLPGETRAPSMLETLLRDRSVPTSPLIFPLSSSGSPAPTTTTGAISDPLVAASAAVTQISTSTHNESISLIANRGIIGGNPDIPSSTSGVIENSNVGSLNVQNLSTSVQGIASMTTIPQTTSFSSNILSNVLSSNIIATTQAPLSTGNASAVSTVNTSVTSSTGGEGSSNMHQLLLPAQFIQVQGTDGSTGLGIVHSGSLDLRLPPGTRVIKSPSGIVRHNAPVTVSQPNARPLNLLHNVKILQNRQIVRTVVVPHSVALQTLGSQHATQLVALNQSPSASNISMETQTASKIPPTQLQKVLGHNVVPGGLVIRAVRPTPALSDLVGDDSTITKPPNPTTIIHHTAESHQKSEKDTESEKPKIIPIVQAQEEGLAERLSRHYLKTALLASTSTQSVGTQTQTTAVKPVTGQLVNQVVMNHLRGITTSSLPIVTSVPVASSVPSGSPLSLGPPNVVSSETLEQLREFESVFEKVSSKSVKSNESNTEQNFSSPGVSSEESMIAAQLLNMANETPAATAASSYVCSISAAGTETQPNTSIVSTSTNTSGILGTRLSEGTFITIPCTTQGGTLILVNPSVSTPSGIVTMATSGMQTSQPPPPASPALSTTSSHSSVASSPSSSSGKSKGKNSKPKVSTSPSSTVTTKPKSPPPPKAPPKPAVAKPQVEESDETKARIQAILDQYKQDLANTPQPQPAPRNRKNCPPPKNEGKSSSKKKSTVKKTEGNTSTSPATSDSGHLQSVSPSPAPLAATPSGEDSEGSVGGASTSSQFKEEKPKIEESVTPQILQGVVVSNMKVDPSALGGTITSLPQGIAGGRVVQLIRQGGKVTAITTRQPYPKAKSGLSAGGPPPNVTIQGRINMNDIMESQLASLLAGGSSTINQNSALISKLIQTQQHQPPGVQQVVVQTSGSQGQHIIQQVSLQPVIATTGKAHTSGQVISARTTGETTSTIKTQQKQPSPSVGVSASPGTPHHGVSSPSTPSPAPELPHTPSSFQAHEEDSSSSTHSHDAVPAGPLPPFFTLTKQFMVPSQQQFREKTLNEATLAPNTIRQTSSNTPLSSRTTSFGRTENTFIKNIGSGGTKTVKSNISASVMLAHSAPSSPIVNAGDVLDMSSVSEPSSLENSPSIISRRPPMLNATSELRSNSLDSVKSDLSIEEVQIPPSPATLTKQLQNAYMTEAALSPSVSHSHMSSNSSYSSPTTVQDISFTDASVDHRSLSPNLGHHSYSLTAVAGGSGSNFNNSNPGSSSNNNHVIDNSSLACLSSPSGDVYLDQAGVGLSLDSLVEERPQSPSLSDLVPAVPLLSWSPRSADSIIVQSPSLNEALTTNMTLDVHHSEDSLCDSSTGFPGLFGMEGDGASVSSSTSEEMHSNVVISNSLHTSSSSTLFSVASNHLHITENKKSKPTNREQDHTISSTRCEDMNISSEITEIAGEYPNSKTENSLKSKSGPSGESPKKEGETSKCDKEEDESNLNTRNKNRRSQRGKREEQGKRRSQRQSQATDKKNKQNIEESLAHNGYEEKPNDKIFDDVKDTSLNTDLQIEEKSPIVLNCQQSASSSQEIKLKYEIKEEEKSEDKKPILAENKSEPEETVRQTRGSKRRSDSDVVPEEKRNKSLRSRRSEPEAKIEDAHFDDGSLGALTRSTRGRHVSGTSDSSSNYSLERVSTPCPQDSPLSTSRRRKRRESHDSSISSRDGSPLTVLLSSQRDGTPTPGSGVHTRRSSSRDHAKKTRCRCCGDQQQQTSQGASNRRSSGRMSRGSGPPSSNS